MRQRLFILHKLSYSISSSNEIFGRDEATILEKQMLIFAIPLTHSMKFPASIPGQLCQHNF